MKAAALLVVFCSSLASASLARVICQDPPNSWGKSNCNGDDNWLCGQSCGQCMDENDRHGYAGYWRASDNKCDCYCW
ncbi:hypothetical protein EsH8_VIII_000472 [Colletotrichum jinshuiense]